MNDTPRSLDFPPLLSGEKVVGDPLDAAIAAAKHEVEPGRIHYVEDPLIFRIALTLAPEGPLQDALPVNFAVALGLYDALGTLAPPEVACHFVWPDRIKVNGALCGRIRSAASTTHAETEPDWLIVALDVPLSAQSPAPGGTPDVTTLHDEGCGEITVPDLIEAFARHTMNWLHIFLTDGFAPVHEAWRTKADALGQEVTAPEPGTFVGLDERGGMILKSDSTTKILPLIEFLLGTNTSDEPGDEASPDSRDVHP